MGPADQFRSAADGAGGDWFVVQEAMEVVGEGLGGGVAFGRLFLQAFEANRFEIHRNAAI